MCVNPGGYSTDRLTPSKTHDGNDCTKDKKELMKYESRGLKIQTVHIDNEFNNDEFEMGLNGCYVEPYATEEHVGYIEQEIKVLKERARCILSTLPFNSVPKIIVLSLVQHVVHMLNSFPTGNGLSKHVAPATIVEGRGKLDFKNKFAPFGQYAEVWNGTDNTMRNRTTPCIV